MNWYMDVLKKYAVFSGRACRTEYWMFFLFNFTITLALGLVAGILKGAGVLSALYSLAVLLPNIAVSFRRLHDTGRSGWWLLISFIPLIGAIILIVFFVTDSQPEKNQYGPNPKMAA